MTKTLDLFLCTIDWQHELGSAGDVRLYEGLKSAKHGHECYAQCGITRVKATLEYIDEPVPQDLRCENEPDEKG